MCEWIPFPSAALRPGMTPTMSWPGLSRPSRLEECRASHGRDHRHEAGDDVENPPGGQRENASRFHSVQDTSVTSFDGIGEFSHRPCTFAFHTPSFGSWNRKRAGTSSARIFCASAYLA